jgi:hypothetical protein
MTRLNALIVSLILPLILLADPPKGYYRFPAAGENKIIFTAEGDLWKVDINGGAAQRLTSHLGSETNAAVSPDGKLIAFSAQYEGPTEVYTIPFDGGIPTRRTFDGENATVVGWTPDGKIIYQTGHFSTLPNRQLLTIDNKTGAINLIPLNQASDGSFDARGNTLYFTRLPFQGSHTKRYKGGTAHKISGSTHWAQRKAGACERCPSAQTGEDGGRQSRCSKGTPGDQEGQAGYSKRQTRASSRRKRAEKRQERNGFRPARAASGQEGTTA